MTDSIKRIAIIGGGASGIIAADVCRQKGLSCVVYEKSNNIGGVWKFTNNKKHLVVGDHHRHPMYDSLRTNLPIEIMEINANYPFTKPPPSSSSSSSPSSFVGHKEVYNYLESYCNERQLHELIRFSTTVKRIEYLHNEKQWSVESISGTTTTTTASDDDDSSDSNIKCEKFDNVIICNGHYNIPSIPIYEGIDNFKGRVIHSIDYSISKPNDFNNMSIVVIGARSSATDIAREISHFAKHTYVSDRNFQQSAPVNYGKLSHYPGLSSISNNGDLIFEDGSSLTDIDIILFCTGYLYDYPFLKVSDSINSNDDTNYDQLIIDKGRAIINIYDNLFLNDNPSLALIGLPWSVVPFHMFFLQAHWVSSVFLDNKLLPDKNVRDTWIENQIDHLKANNEYPDKFHYLGDNQWDYFRYLANQSKLLDIEEEDYIRLSQEIYNDNKKNIPKYPGALDCYRSRSYNVDRKAGTWSV